MSEVSAPVVGSVKLGVVVGGVGGVVGGVGVGGVDDGDPDGLLDAESLGDGELLVADAEGEGLVGGADCVGVGDDRPVDVGPAELLADGVFDAVSRLVPVPPPPTGVTGTEAVAGATAWLADWPGVIDLPTLPVVVAVGVTLLVSRTAIMAMIPQAARPTPAINRPRLRERRPPYRSGSSLYKSLSWAGGKFGTTGRSEVIGPA